MEKDDGAITLIRPAAGRHSRVPLSGSGALVFSFNPADAVFRRRDGALHLSFENGSTITVPDFFDGESIASLSVFLPDGTRMDAGELLTLFAPRLTPPAGLPGFTAGEAPPAGRDVADLSALAVEEDFLFSIENARADDAARHNLAPVYQEVIFRDGEITIGPSIYGNLLPIGGETGLHVHLDNQEAEMLDVDALIARLPGLFPGSQPIVAIAVTGGAANRVILDGRRLSARRETLPLEGLGTTQFDRYTYRFAATSAVELYLETILHLAL